MYFSTTECMGCTQITGKMLLASITPLIRQVDFAFGWPRHVAGDVVYAQDAPACDVFIVLSGRLRSVVKVIYF